MNLAMDELTDVISYSASNTSFYVYEEDRTREGNYEIEVTVSHALHSLYPKQVYPFNFLVGSCKVTKIMAPRTNYY